MKMSKIIALLMMAFAITSCTSPATGVPSTTAPAATPAPSPAAPLAASEVSNVVLHSTALDRDMAMRVYLPKGYDGSRTYPVLYMIHGYGGNEGSWFNDMHLDRKADELINAGRIAPLIIVCPDVDNSYGLNTSPTDMYEDYLINDVIGYVDSHYRTIAEKPGRYIGGLSMGGFISLHLAFAHPELFAKAGGHSPALWLDDWSKGSSIRYMLYPSDEKRKERDPIQLAQTQDLSGIQVYLDCGLEDEYKFYEGSRKLQEVLESRGLPSQLHLNAGRHEGDYWTQNSQNYLLFYAGVE
ncbi:alpha/beta hydrolase [Paenibacillus athensensis]|nr:alpha/beta hydrolase-fold protein [Paenibacillus athensensis]